MQQNTWKQSRSDEPKQATILLVDDEAVIRDLCAKALKRYRTFQAESALQALDLLLRERIDAVITDVMMPEMDGLELLRKAKELQPNLPVIVMTALSDRDTILSALRADADDFICKPISILQFQSTLEKVLERKALKEELLQLKRLDRLKSDFLGLVSHKLKTPITSISLFLQNLAADVADPSDPAFRGALQLVLRESDYMGHLIQDLLFYSEILLREGPPQPIRLDLTELAREAIKILQLAARSREVGISLDLKTSLPPMELDRMRISFALRALLDNAVKFSPPGGTVTLEVEALAQEVRLVIRDNGPGISPEELPKVFEKFYQVDPARTGQVRGFGLGLFYARQFVQVHGGTLELRNLPTGGIAAIVRLPRIQESPPAAG